MFVDFRDFNKAGLKDDFPLPHIDVLIDNTTNHGLLSFMDGYAGYNQVKMAVEDVKKTTFVTPWETYCYIVMPFRLKMLGLSIKGQLLPYSRPNAQGGRSIFGRHDHKIQAKEWSCSCSSKVLY